MAHFMDMQSAPFVPVPHKAIFSDVADLRHTPTSNSLPKCQTCKTSILLSHLFQRSDLILRWVSGWGVWGILYFNSPLDSAKL